MSRSGYSEDGSNRSLVCWRGAVNSAIRGKRGQAFLELAIDVLDSMPVKELCPNNFAVEPAKYCLLGVVASVKGIEVSDLGDDEQGRSLKKVGDRFGVAPALVAEIMFENDESVENGLCKSFEVCGPMRPGYPDWGNHRKTMWAENTSAPAQRWSHMRNWLQENITGGGPLNA
jgi:hypothetical protein